MTLPGVMKYLTFAMILISVIFRSINLICINFDIECQIEYFWHILLFYSGKEKKATHVKMLVLITFK